jgi:hypothetical protein
LKCSGNSPSPRSSHASWVVHNKLFIHGGEGRLGSRSSASGSRVCLDDMFCLDLRNRTWTSIASGLAPLPRKLHTITVVPGDTQAHVIMFGGAATGAGQPFGDMYIAPAQSLSSPPVHWSVVEGKGTMPIARYSHSALGFDNQMVVFGGHSGLGGLLNDVAVFDVPSGQWEMPPTSGRAPCPRYGHAACRAGGGGHSRSGGEMLMLVHGGCRELDPGSPLHARYGFSSLQPAQGGLDRLLLK